MPAPGPISRLKPQPKRGSITRTAQFLGCGIGQPRKQRMRGPVDWSERDQRAQEGRTVTHAWGQYGPID